MESKFTPDQSKIFEERPEKIYRKPKKAGVCDECGGAIVRRVVSLFRGQYSFDQPACKDCRTSYWGEKNAPKVGVEEFQNRMQTSFTI